MFNLINLENNVEILDLIPDWIKITSISGVVLYANKPLRNKLGFNPQGMRIGTLLNSTAAGLFREELAEEDFKGEDLPRSDVFFEGRHYNKLSSPITDDEGTIYAIVDIYRDETDRKHMERKMSMTNEMMKRDLEFTKTIQESILPKQSQFGHLKVDYLYNPCEQLSGDIFDVIATGKNKISAYICDVSGHGVPAAMITVFVRETMRNMENFYSSAHDLKELHRRFLNLRLDINHYLTMFHILIDTDENTVSYSNAGHNCPMFLYRDGQVEIISITGKPVTNYFDEVNYDEKIAEFKPGDKILLITDGITECRNINGEEFGEERVRDLFQKNPDNILKAIEEEVYEFSGTDKFDDMCALLIDYETR